jgi:hypothetical protein
MLGRTRRLLSRFYVGRDFGAVRAFRANVRSYEYLSDEESYHLPNGTRASLESQLANPPTRYSSCQALRRLKENTTGEYDRQSEPYLGG